MSTESVTKISKRVEKELHQTKVVIRRLPPDFTEEKFLEAVNPLPSNSYFYFAPGDPTLGPHGCCRAYIAFTKETDILPFRDLYDGLILESEKGAKYRMTVEYAPFQNIPKQNRKKPDARCGTIEQDADFVSFLESYEAAEEPTQSLDLVSYLQHLEAAKTKEVQATPLTEYLDKRGLRRKGKSGEVRKKHKGEGKSKTKVMKEDLKSKHGEDSSQDSKKKNRKQDRTSEQSPRLATSKQDDGPTQWPTIEPIDKSKSAIKDSRSESKGGPRGGDRRSRERGEGRTKNRDRPDKAIYTPRSREESSQGDKRKEDGDRFHGRSQRYRGSKDDGEYRQRDDRPSGRSRDQGKGSRDRQKSHDY